MRKDRLLIVLTLVGSIVLWWPMIMAISLVTHWWFPLPLIALGSGLATVLLSERWMHFALASGFGTFVGIISGYVIWRPADGIETAYSGLLVTVATVAVLITSLVANSAVRRLTASTFEGRHAVWIALGCCFAIGPIALALTPPLIKHRVARDDQAALNRLEALNNAAQKIMVEPGGPEKMCVGSNLQRYYSGPLFSDEDWSYITGHFVNRDGYVFRIYCQEKGGYAIEAWPARGVVDGTRRLCADEKHKIGCDIGSSGLRRACKPCGV